MTLHKFLFEIVRQALEEACGRPVEHTADRTEIRFGRYRLSLCGHFDAIVCLAPKSVQQASYWPSHTVIRGTCRLLLIDNIVKEAHFLLDISGRI